MKTPLLLTLAVTASVLTTLLTQRWMAPSKASTADDGVAADRSSDLQPQDAPIVRELRAEIARLETQIASLAARPMQVERASAALSQAEVESIVRDLLQSEAGKASALAEASTLGEEADQALAALVANPAEAFAELRRLGLNTSAGDAIWAAAAKAGTTEDLLELYREAVEQDPNSVEANYNLAKAALDAAQADPNHSNGVWWRESDDQLGRVLELDEGFADARYDKALNLSFWPSAFGRQPEAIRHFEQLVGDGNRLSEGRHRQSFLWLGNLYAQNGRIDDALATYRSGLGQYPDDASLLAKLTQLENQ